MVTVRAWLHITLCGMFLLRQKQMIQRFVGHYKGVG